MLCKYDFVNTFFNEICSIDGMSVVIEDNKARLIPPKSKYYYMPPIIINDLSRLNIALGEYIYAVMCTHIRSTIMDKRHDVKYFLGILNKNLSNYDSLHFEEYVENYTQFILDETFSKYKDKTLVGRAGEYDLLVKRSEEYYGLETPYLFKAFKKNKHIEYELPLIRYGIYTNKKGEKVVRIYAIQRKRNYVNNSLVQDVKASFRPINSGVKDYRDVAPSMVACLTMFVSLLHQEEIRHIEAVDYVPRRYTHFLGAKTEEERDLIQYRATNKFLKLFLRLSNQIDGFNITSVPNDIDSFLHITLDDELVCKSKNLLPYLVSSEHEKVYIKKEK